MISRQLLFVKRKMARVNYSELGCRNVLVDQPFF